MQKIQGWVHSLSDISLTLLLQATLDYEWGWNIEKHTAERQAHLDFSEGTYPHGQDARFRFPLEFQVSRHTAAPK